MELLECVKDFYAMKFKATNENCFCIYGNSNENINEYMNLFELEGRKMFVIGSSFDQAINASLERPSSITILDKCPFTDHYRYLKMAAFCEMAREEFVYFVCKRDFKQGDLNKSFIGKESFDKIKHTLRSFNYDSYYIWDEIIKTYSQREVSWLFHNGVSYLTEVIKSNRYLLNDDNYYKARKAIMDIPINVINKDIVDYDFATDYDVIWFSNVFSWLIDVDLEKQIFGLATNSLNEFGKILFSYYWAELLDDEYNAIMDRHGVNLERHKLHGAMVSHWNYFKKRELKEDRKKREIKDYVLIYEKK